MSWHAYGSGDPVVLVVPGLAATPGEARIPASGLAGTRVVMTLPGHGDEPDAPPGYWDYGTIARDVLRAADEVRATCAIGVSLGAGALTRVVAESPDRFERLALLLPAALDEPRPTDVQDELRKLTTKDVDRLREYVAAPLPTGYALGDYVEARAKALTRLTAAIELLAGTFPVEDRRVLADVDVPVLVIGAVGDTLHPADVARATAKAFPHGVLELFDSPAPLITHRAQVRSLLQGFFRRD
ncbi:alpha/beta fold hydrolase [Actinocrispum wychmicini]|uniref:Pimeloyl-ACP methyl ester carboxylesterase n=1 Tax=Actinocrispum wychmicini TaxID=1213861 RepID=A0A4R2K5N9_9PSEU|nr:alpha/beta hydrolase [Actinocrispum wychmicini]TCO65186.1 pimeloyl-ACP methyl ester carboxylesterase [Actinocrispum wychmicini]